VHAPRCWLPRRSWQLECNQCHSLFNLVSFLCAANIFLLGFTAAGIQNIDNGWGAKLNGQLVWSAAFRLMKGIQLRCAPLCVRKRMSRVESALELEPSDWPATAVQVSGAYPGSGELASSGVECCSPPLPSARWDAALKS
jgi:hypothetical protein